MLDNVKKYKLLIIILFALLLFIFVVLIIINRNSEPSIPEDPEFTDFVNQVEESLDPYLAEVVAKDPNKNYSSPNTQTYYSLASQKYFYDSTLPWWNVADGSASNGESIAAFATALSILSGRPFSPASVAYVASEERIWDLHNSAPPDLFKKLSNYYGLFYREVEGMNSNILDYYLDQKCLVIIHGAGDTPYTSTGAYLVVIAAYPDADSYLISSPTNPDYRDTLATRTEVISALKGEANFYVLSGTTDRIDLSPYSENFNYTGQ